MWKLYDIAQLTQSQFTTSWNMKKISLNRDLKRLTSCYGKKTLFTSGPMRSRIFIGRSSDLSNSTSSRG